MIEKLIGAVMLGKTVVSVSLLHRFVLTLASVVAFAVISALLCCALLASGLYVIHLELLNHGFDPISTALMIFALLAIMSIAIVAITVMRLQKLKDMTPYQLHVDIPRLLNMPQLEGVGGILQSFLDGLSTGSRSSTRH